MDFAETTEHRDLRAAVAAIARGFGPKYYLDHAAAGTPCGGINVGDSLTRSAAARPAHLAVVDGDQQWTYRDFNGWVNQLAHGLAARGFTRGDALGVASGNSAEFHAVYFACAKLGLACVPINLGWRSEEVAYVLDHSGARGLVAETQLVEKMREAIVKVSAIADVIVAPGLGAGYKAEPADRTWTTLAGVARAGTTDEPEFFVLDRDPISYLYTSGTTSFPKGVVASHVAIRGTTRAES